MSSRKETRDKSRVPGKPTSLRVAEGRVLVVHLKLPMSYRKDLASDVVSFARRVIKEVKAQVKVCLLRDWLQATETTSTDSAQPYRVQKLLQRGCLGPLRQLISRKNQKSFQSRPRYSDGDPAR